MITRENMVFEEYKNDDGLYTLLFVDHASEEAEELKLYSNKWDDVTRTSTEDEETYNKANDTALKYLGYGLDELDKALGTSHTIYVDDEKVKTPAYFEERKTVSKFSENLVGKIIKAPLTDVTEDKYGIHLFYEYEGKTYRTNMGYTIWTKTGTSLVNPGKREKAIAKFEALFETALKDKDTLVGSTVMIQVQPSKGTIPIFGTCLGLA